MPMPEATMRKAIELLPNCRFIQGYGSSESHTAVILQPDEHAVVLGGLVESEERKRSCGRAGALAMARVVNKDGVDVKPGEVGEILVVDIRGQPGGASSAAKARELSGS